MVYKPFILVTKMSAKCAYAKFMYEKCKREKGVCHIKKRLMDDCNNQNLYFSGPQYKLRHKWLNDTRKGRNTAQED